MTYFRGGKILSKAILVVVSTQKLILAKNSQIYELHNSCQSKLMSHINFYSLKHCSLGGETDGCHFECQRLQGIVSKLPQMVEIGNTQINARPLNNFPTEGI
jgi:hypothetical protein